LNHKLLVLMSPTARPAFKKQALDNLSLVDYDLYYQGLDVRNRRILMISQVDSLGYDLGLMGIIKDIQESPGGFEGSIGGLIVKSDWDLYTKSSAQNMIFQCNCLGLAFVGHSVVEITKDYRNFETWQKTMAMSLEEICFYHCRALIKRLEAAKKLAGKSILSLHSSALETSNTLGLWHLVKNNLSFENREIYIRNGSVADCKGCSFQTCIGFGKQASCYYDDIMVEEVLPSIQEADYLVWVCPNYNDSISANLLAVINRLTVLYRQISFHDKGIYAVVVSGNSGSDAVAKQLIGALNINKGFYLPPKFVIMATANAPLKVLTLEGIHDKALRMAKRMEEHMG